MLQCLLSSKATLLVPGIYVVYGDYSVRYIYFQLITITNYNNYYYYYYQKVVYFYAFLKKVFSISLPYDWPILIHCYKHIRIFSNFCIYAILPYQSPLLFWLKEISIDNNSSTILSTDSKNLWDISFLLKY